MCFYWGWGHSVYKRGEIIHQLTGTNIFLMTRMWTTLKITNEKFCNKVTWGWMITCCNNLGLYRNCNGLGSDIFKRNWKLIYSSEVYKFSLCWSYDLVKCQRLVATWSRHPPSVKLGLIFMRFSLSLQDLLQDLGRYKTYFDIFLMMIFMQIK